jgi:hypothetical protein
MCIIYTREDNGPLYHIRPGVVAVMTRGFQGKGALFQAMGHQDGESFDHVPALLGSRIAGNARASVCRQH